MFQMLFGIQDGMFAYFRCFFTQILTLDVGFRGTIFAQNDNLPPSVIA